MDSGGGQNQGKGRNGEMDKLTVKHLKAALKKTLISDLRYLRETFNHKDTKDAQRSLRFINRRGGPREA